MTTDPRIALVDRFYQAWVNADYDALTAIIAPDAQWIMTGRSRFAGATKGREAILAMRRQMSELTRDTFRPLRSDSYDIIVSDYHTVVIDRFLAERDGMTLDSHEGILVLVEDGQANIFLHYFYDQYAFDDFWSGR